MNHCSENYNLNVGPHGTSLDWVYLGKGCEDLFGSEIYDLVQNCSAEEIKISRSTRLAACPAEKLSTDDQEKITRRALGIIATEIDFLSRL